MRIEDAELRKRFSGPGRCEHCKRICYRECHHIFTRGPESVNQIDVLTNLIALCQECHLNVGGTVPRDRLLTIVAMREMEYLPGMIAELHRLRRLTPEGREPHERTEW